MTTLRALLYADVRSAINQLKAIRTSPGRAIVWLLFALLIVAGIVLRIIRAAHHRGLPLETFSPQLSTDTIAGFIIMAIGFTLAIGSRFAGLFAHPAEARFIIGSPAKPFIATIYVQARDLVLNSFRRGIALLYGALIYLPDGLSAGGFARDLVIVIVAFTTVAAIPLARQLLDKRYVVAVAVIGWLVVIAGAFAPLRDFAILIGAPAPFGPPLVALPGAHPGYVLLGGAGTQGAVIAALLVCLAIVLIFVARHARDAYPELYELSMNRLARTERVRTRMFGAQGTRAAANTPVHAASLGAKAPAGVAIFVWRAWTEYRRSNSARSTAIETGICLIAGYAIARFAGDDWDVILPVATTLSTILFLVALARSAVLAGELRRPLFWLSTATLFERLCALLLAHTWRMIGWFVLAGIGLAAGRAPLPTIAAALLGAPAAIVLAVAIGYASFALLPNDADQRGPMMLVRWLLGYVFAVPALAAGIAAGIFLGGALPGIAGGGITAVLEAAVLLGFASWRLDAMSIPLR